MRVHDSHLFSGMFQGYLSIVQDLACCVKLLLSEADEDGDVSLCLRTMGDFLARRGRPHSVKLIKDRLLPVAQVRTCYLQEKYNHCVPRL